MPGQECRTSCSLHIGSHNVNGSLGSQTSHGRSKVQGLARLWCQQQLAVVCVQETHLTHETAGDCDRRLNSAAERMHHPGWVTWWSHHMGNSAGVGILVRRDIAEGGGKIRRNRSGQLDVDIIVPGRVIQLALDWGGHQLSIGCLYLPSADASAQRAIITGQLGPWAQSQRSLIWAGDYNFVSSVALDRSVTIAAIQPNLGDADVVVTGAAPVRVSRRLREAAEASLTSIETRGDGRTIGGVQAGGNAALGTPRWHADTRTAELFQAACPNLADIFRIMHPGRRSYTYIHSRSASRIDRFMASSGLKPYVVGCDILKNSMGDHRPIGLKLIARLSTSEGGRGLRRMRMHFAAHEDLKEVMRQWLEEKVVEGPLGNGRETMVGRGERVTGEGGGIGQLQTVVLNWWGRLKVEIMVKAASLNKQARHRRLYYEGESVEVIRQELHEVTKQAEVEGWGSGNLEGVVRARARYAEVSKSQDKAAALECRREWVLGKERPSPLISKLTKPPSGDKEIVALRDHEGRLEGRACALPDIVAKFWAHTSQAVVTSATDRARVLAPLRADPTRCISTQVAEGLGEKSVAREEVAQALGKAKIGSAPGPDGIPYDMYKQFADVFIPVMAEVFTAVGTGGQAGKGFLDGAITTLYKDKGDRADPANYRPITLLNADYRILTKALAIRLGSALKNVVAVEQTAFLQDRYIGENILLLQLLPRYLKQRGKSAVVAFCDFAKAYDTVDRGFLYEAMECMGAGVEFIGWVKILLTDTRACAVVNGHVSLQHVFVSGVRQGCPLSPLLYLFIAQALQSWLKESGVGIDVGRTERTVAAQYADDTKALLKSLEIIEVTTFLGVMRTFQGASGQRLNEDKTELLPLGAVGRLPPPSTVANLKVVAVARGVGIYFSNNEERSTAERQKRRAVRNGSATPLQAALQAEVQAGAAAFRLATAPATRTATRRARVLQDAAEQSATIASQVPIQPANSQASRRSEDEHDVASASMVKLLERILRTVGTLSKLQLSAFGRAAAAAAYGVSTLLFQAQHTGLPQEHVTRVLQQATIRLVDRGQAHDATSRALTGVPTDLLYGRPCEGGFGALAWVEHIRARHACEGVRLMMQGTEAAPACYWVAAQVLKGCHQYMTPLILGCRNLPADMANLPHGPLSRMFEGLQSLPAIEDVKESLLSLGDWCHAAPLWGNPLFSAQLMSVYLEPARSLAGLGSIGDLVSKALYIKAIGGLLCRAGATWIWERGAREAFWIKVVISLLPSGWVEAAMITEQKIMLGLITRPVLADALAVLMPRMGWRLQNVGQRVRVVPLVGLSVRDATSLQLGKSHDERRRAHAWFIHEAYERGGNVSTSDLEHMELSRLFVKCWAVGLENKFKEVFWRLTVDGVADGHRWESLSRQCACGVVEPRRKHYFWECPIARTMVQVMQTCWPRMALVSKANLWLMRTPEGVPAESWNVVCLSVLHSMDVGRRKLLSLKLSGGGPEVEDPNYGASASRMHRLPVNLVRSNRDKLRVASGVSIANFWDRISDFRAYKGVSKRAFFEGGTRGVRT